MEKKIKKLAFISAWLIVLPAFMFSQVSFWGFLTPPVARADTVAQVQEKLDQALKKKASLEANLGQIQSAVATTQQKINQSKTVIQDTTQAISEKEQEVIDLNNKIELQKQLLTSFMQELYYSQSQTPVDVALADGSFLDIFGNADHLQTMSDKIVQVVSDISDTQDQVNADKTGLLQTKQQQGQVLVQTASVQQGLLSDQADTQQNIQEQDATIAELQQKLAELSGDLSSLLGQNLNTKDVEKAAGIAGSATGVRTSFILGELMQESGLGRYTGGCTYSDTRVKPADATVFKQIMKSLGYGIDDKKISCAQSGGYGGAMGIAQFMPTTWVGYESYIANATGDNPPNPWSVIDGVMGMAKKLAQDGATNKKGEYAASMVYYCGTSHPTNTYPGRVADCNRYAADVQSLANGYDNND